MISKLLKLGFVDLAKNLFQDDDIPTEEIFERKSFILFQLEHMGKYLELEKPSERDPRVPGFIPDLWQRQLFDAIDAKESALIIAPTSSGKTYACYYCMEQVKKYGLSSKIILLILE